MWRAWHIVGTRFRHMELLTGWINGLKNKKPFGFADISIYKCGLVIVFRRPALMRRGPNLYCKYCLVLKSRLTIARFIISWGNASLDVSPTLETCLTQVKTAQLSGASEITYSQGTVNSTGLQPKLCSLHSAPQGLWPEHSIKSSLDMGPRPVAVAGGSPQSGLVFLSPLGSLCTAMPSLSP